MKLKMTLRDAIYLGIIILLLIGLYFNKKERIVTLENGEEVLVSTTKGQLTANDLYEMLKKGDSTSSLLTLIDMHLFGDEYEIDEEMKRKADEHIEIFKSQFGTNYLMAIQVYYGVETEEEFRENIIYTDLKREKAVLDYLRDSLKEEEIKDYYNNKIFPEIKVSHILIAPDIDEIENDDELSDEEKESAIRKAEEDARKKAIEIISKLDKNVEFEILAKENSDDEGTKEKGGDLGYIDKESPLVEEFIEAAYKLETGSYTKEPVKTEYGYHIIYKTEEREKPALETIKTDVEDKVLQEKLLEDEKLFIKTLYKIREQYEVQIYDDLMLEKYKTYKNEVLK